MSQLVAASFCPLREQSDQMADFHTLRQKKYFRFKHCFAGW
jgi:hypothetical protein